MSEAPPSVDEAAEYAAEQAELFKGSHRALWRRFRRQPIELRQFAGPEEHVQMVDHLRVAHLTDMHFGRVTPERVHREAIRMTNAQAPANSTAKSRSETASRLFREIFPNPNNSAT